MTTLPVYDTITLQRHELHVCAPLKINNVQTNNNKYLTISHLWIRIGKVCRSILRRHMIEEKSSNHEGNRHTCSTKVSLWEQLNTPAHGGNLWVTSLPWSDSRGTRCIQQSHLTLWIYNNNRTHLWQFQRLQSKMVNVYNNYLAVLTKLNQYMHLVVCCQVATCVCPRIRFQKYCHIYPLNL